MNVLETLVEHCHRRSPPLREGGPLFAAFHRLVGFLESVSTAPTPATLPRTEWFTADYSRHPKAGAYFAIMAAEPFGIDDPTILQEVAFAHLCIDCFAHLVDDLSDNRGVFEPSTLHISSLLLAQAASTCGAITGDARIFWRYWTSYFQQASAAERHLYSLNTLREPYSSEDMAMLGQKSALLKIGPALFASICKDYSKLDLVERGFEDAATALQLLDDLVDFPDDWICGSYTYPVSLVSCQADVAANRGAVNAMPVDVVLGVLRLAMTSLEQASASFARLGASMLVSSIDSVRQNVTLVSDDILHMMSTRPYPESFVQVALLRKALDPRLAH